MTMTVLRAQRIMDLIIYSILLGFLMTGVYLIQRSGEIKTETYKIIDAKIEKLTSKSRYGEHDLVLVTDAKEWRGHITFRAKYEPSAHEYAQSQKLYNDIHVKGLPMTARITYVKRLWGVFRNMTGIQLQAGSNYTFDEF